MSMSGGELKVLLALDKLAEVIPAYRSVHGAFRVISGDGPTLEYTILSNNTGLNFILERPDTGIITISTDTSARITDVTSGLFLSPSLNYLCVISYRDFAPDRITLESVNLNTNGYDDLGYGYNLNPSDSAYIHFELRIYPAV